MRASQDNLACCSIAKSVVLLVVILLGRAAVVCATVVLGPARASRDGLNEATCFIARGNAGLEALVVLTVDLLLLRGEITKSVILLGDGRGLRRLGGRFPGAAAFGPILRIALKLHGIRPAVLGRQRRKVSSPRGFFRGDKP